MNAKPTLKRPVVLLTLAEASDYIQALPKAEAMQFVVGFNSLQIWSLLQAQNLKNN